MSWYYSASERAFFSSDLMSTGSMPSDKVAVTDDDFRQLMADQVAGKLIRPGAGNVPESANQNLTEATRFGDISMGKITATGLDLNGNADVSGTLKVTGASTLGAVNAGNVSASGTLSVTGASTLTGKLTANGGVSTKALSATSITNSGAMTNTGNLTVNGSTTVKALTATGLDLNGNADVSGTFTAHGKSTLAGVSAGDIDAKTLDTTGDVNVGGLLAVTGESSLEGKLTVENDIQGYWFLSKPNLSGPFIRAQFPDAVRGTTPDATKWMHISVYDKNGLTNATNRFGAINFKLDTDGSSAIQLVPMQNIAGSSAKTAALGVYIEQDGTARVEGPTPPENAGTLVIPNLAWLDAYSPTLSRNGCKVLSAPDYNSIVEPGFYHCNSSGHQNGPGGARKLIVFTRETDGSSYLTQLALPVDAGYLPSIRYLTGGGGWTSWQTFLLSESDESITARSISLSASGMVSYPGNTSSSVPNWGFSINNLSKGDNPDRSITARYYLYDKDNPTLSVGALSGVVMGIDTDGKTYARLLAFPNVKGSSANGSIDIYAKPDGTIWTQVPETADDANGRQIATAAFTLDHGGRSWGLGRSAMPLDQAGFASKDVNEIDKCGFYGLSGAQNAAWGTSILLHIQRPWTAGPGAFQFNFGTDGEFAVRTFNNSTTWSDWRKVAHQDWVLSQLSTSGEETHICQLDNGRSFTRGGGRICGSVMVQLYRSIDSSGEWSDDFGIYVGNNRVAVVTLTWSSRRSGGAGYGRSADQTAIGSFEVSASIPAGSTITLRRESSNASGTVTAAFAHVTVSA